MYHYPKMYSRYHDVQCYMVAEVIREMEKYC